MNVHTVKTRIPFDILFIAAFFAGVGVLFIQELTKSSWNWFGIVGGPLFSSYVISYRFKTFELTETQLIIATPFVPFLTRRIDLKKISYVGFKIVPPFYGNKANRIHIHQGKGVKSITLDFRASEEMTVTFIQRLETLGVSCPEMALE